MESSTIGTGEPGENSPLYDARLQTQISTAWQRLANDLRREVPQMAEPVIDWMQNLSGTGRAEDRLVTPEMFPMLLLPRWLAGTLPHPPGDAFEEDLVYSTINGYYAIRLIDNLMDLETTVELEILPAAAIFQTWFQRIYQQYFEWGHPFWAEFQRHWLESAEYAVRDADLNQIDRTQFVEICAKKTCAARIPLAAMAYRGGLPEQIPHWFRFCDLLGRVQQMLDDLNDWYRDAARPGSTTYFLSEGIRRKEAGESVVGWIARDGMRWGIEQLHGWMDELEQAGHALQSDEVTAYLAFRRRELVTWAAEMKASLAGLAELDAILAPAWVPTAEDSPAEPRGTR